MDDKASEHNRIKKVLDSLAFSVIGALREGTPEDKGRLITVIGDINLKMPGITEDEIEVKEFLLALVGLLKGNPTPADSISGTYRHLYDWIVKKAGPERPVCERRPYDVPKQEKKEFLTQLAAAVVLTMQKGTDEDRRCLTASLRDIRKALTPEMKDAGAFINALISILEKKPIPPDRLPPDYVNIYSGILDTIRTGS